MRGDSSARKTVGYSPLISTTKNAINWGTGRTAPIFAELAGDMMETLDVEAQKFWRSVSSSSSNSCSWNNFVTKCEACVELQQITLPVERVLWHTVQRAALDTVTLNEFITFVKRFGPFTACLTKACAVYDTTGLLAPWYHGAASRDECLRRLRTAGIVGSFLVRYSSSRLDCFNVMVQQVDAISDSLLKNTGAAGYCHADARDVKDTWATLADFVQHYQEENLLTRPLPPTSMPDRNEEISATAAAAAPSQSSSHTARAPSLGDLPEQAPLSRLRPSSARLLEDTPASLVRQAELATERANAEGLSAEERKAHRCEALQLVQRALDAAEAAGKPDALTLCKALGLKGGLLLSNEQHSEAVAPYKQALAVLRKHVRALEHKEDAEKCDDHSTHAFRLHAELTTCYLASGDSTTALQHYAEMMASVPHTEYRLKHAESWRQNNPRFADVVQQVQLEHIKVSNMLHNTLL
jgi:tetratricopeptide (TPR) repeat protein